MEIAKHLAAALPEKWVILGLRLRPLSIGHLILLNRLESPFLVESAPGTVSIGDLAVACLICSKTWEENCATLELEDLPGILQRWAERLTNQNGIKRFLPFLYRPIDFEAKLSLYLDYLKYHMEVPTYSIESASKSFSIEAPSWQIIRIFLLMKTNLTDREILDRPYRQSVTDFLLIKAMEGQIRFEDAEELAEAQAFANQIQEQINRGEFDGIPKRNTN